jgi:polysulfide reductase chain C
MTVDPPRSPFPAARQSEWSWHVALYLALSSAGAGAYLAWLLAGLVAEGFGEAVRGGAALGLALVMLGAGFVLLDLGRRDRFYRAAARPRASWESRAFLLIVACTVLGLAQIAGWITGARWAGLLTVPLAPAALGMLLYGALLLKHMRAYPLWRNRLQLALYPAGGLLAGCGVLALDPIAALSAAQGRALGVAIAALAAVVGALLAALLGSTRASGPAGEASVDALVSGRQAALFWGAAVGLGLIAPFVLAAGAGLGVPATLRLAGAAALAGLVALRYVFLAVAHKPSALTFRGAGPWGVKR